MPFALVTGASKGIGKSIAEILAGHQQDLILVARSADLLQQEAQRLSDQFKVRVEAFAIDLSAPDAPQKIYDWCTEKGFILNMLVNNAGYGLSGSFEKYSSRENMDMMQVNMATPVHLIRLFLPMLRSQTKSYILNVASSAAYQAVPGLSLYAASKAFILSFSRGLRQELKKTTVSVTCVSPGATDTDFPNRAKIGKKGMQAAQKVNMTPEAVAQAAVKAMYAGRPEVITGFINKLGAFLVWVLPKGLVETTAMKLYQ